MKKSYLRAMWSWLMISVAFPSALLAVEPPPPVLTNITVTPGPGASSARSLEWMPYPAADLYRIFSATNVAGPFAPDTTGRISGNVFTVTNSQPAQFYRLEVTPMDTNALLTAIVLNRLAYGPTPDDLERLATIGPQTYIDEQLAPESIAENVHNSHPNIAIIEAKLRAATDIVTTNDASLSDLRAWHTLRAVGANRQLLEILLQFFENHFVTQHSKSVQYLNSFIPNSVTNAAAWRNRIAAQFEYLENDRWRNALLNPSCTFYDLLKISAESPAMIIYLDTVNSRGNSSNIANENYARELFELFCNGVDNGYDQNDITVMSRCWTGWSVEKVAVSNAFNPFAAALPGAKSTNVGVWAFNYKSGNHNTATKTLFPGKTVPARFGAPWTTKTYGVNATPGLYQLVIPGRSGTNGIQEGYEVIQSLAGLPFTQEFISIKLCRLFVHDDFPNPNNDPDSPEYAFYNYAAGNLSPEAELVRQCMLAWENSSPKGQIRPILQTIFNSELFRSHGGALHKVKTPLEFLVSSVRALRATNNLGVLTATTDGYAFETPLNRMGTMLLFDRGDPDGYPESAPGWISAGTLTERLRFVQSYCIAPGQTGHTGGQGGTGNDAGNSTCSPVLLLNTKLPLQNPPGSLTSAENVVDYFLSILFPGEGKANLDLYRTAAINFLNTNDSGAPSSFATMIPSSSPGSTYDTRVRGMVGMLMSTQRFQEQ